MELKDIISSGLLELYALGLASAEENSQVQGWISQYPEVRAELEQIEMAMEDYATLHFMQPSQDVKKKVFSQLGISLAATVSLPGTASAEDANGKTRNIQTNTTSYFIPPYIKWAIAASVILLLGSLVLNYTYYNRYKTVNADLQATRSQLTQQKNASDMAIRQLQEQKQNIETTRQQLNEQKQTADLTKEQLQQQKQSTGAIQEELERQRLLAEARDRDINVMTNKNSLPVVLTGTPHAPDALAKIFWMRNTGEVYVDPTYLPQAPSGRQYQLWAIVDDKPVDAGMISTSKGVYHIQRMKSFGKADAFAITLEKAGGSPTPTMDQMYVMAKISL